jgi:hypothetical protein
MACGHARSSDLKLCDCYLWRTQIFFVNHPLFEEKLLAFQDLWKKDKLNCRGKMHSSSKQMRASYMLKLLWQLTYRGTWLEVHSVVFRVNMVFTSSSISDISPCSSTVADQAQVDACWWLFQNDCVHEWLSTDTQCEIFWWRLLLMCWDSWGLKPSASDLHCKAEHCMWVVPSILNVHTHV